MTKKNGPVVFNNILEIRRIIVFAAAILCLAVTAAKLSAGSIQTEDLRLFTEKCGKCHGWNKAINAFSGQFSDKRVQIVTGMSKKIPGFVSDDERARIIHTLSANDLELVAAEAEKISPANRVTRPEMIRKFISAFHGVLLALVFLVLGISMAMTGLKRFFMDINIFKSFPVKFKRNKHIKTGKIYIVLFLLGLSGGLTMFYMSRFRAGGAKYHLFAAILISVLYAIGGLTGLALSKKKGKAPAGLKYTHLACNISATLLFVFNVVTGLALALVVFL